MQTENRYMQTYPMSYPKTLTSCDLKAKHKLYKIHSKQYVEILIFRIKHDDEQDEIVAGVVQPSILKLILYELYSNILCMVNSTIVIFADFNYTVQRQTIRYMHRNATKRALHTPRIDKDVVKQLNEPKSTHNFRNITHHPD